VNILFRNEGNPLLDSLLKWKETYELSFELADVTFTLFNRTVDYCRKNNIPIDDELDIWNLTKRARRLFTLIEEVNAPNYIPSKYLPSTDSLQHRRSTEDLPECAVVSDCLPSAEG